MKMTLPESVRFILNRLFENGKEAYIVGGCVRDHLLSKIPFDYDITTNASPTELKSIFSDVRTLETGLKHGTLTVIINKECFEVTTYRIDGEYTDHRRPSEVTFTGNLREDLARRDFTINAIAYNEKDGVVDLFGGIEDVKGKIIRAVGDPEKRFEEDALRILRAVRFSSVLSFDIEDNTAKAAKNKKHLLSSVSAERIYTEWRKLLTGKNAYSVIKTNHEIISEFLYAEKPFLPSEALFIKASSYSREIGLFAGFGADASERFLDYASRLKIDGKTKRLGESVLKSLDLPMDSIESMRIAAIRIGREAARILKEIKIMYFGDLPNSLEIFDRATDASAVLSVSDLEINGNDLKALGFEGKSIGRALTELVIMCAEEKIKNERTELLSFAIGHLTEE